MGLSEEKSSSEYYENEKDEYFDEIRKYLMTSQLNSNISLKKQIEKISSSVSSIITLRYDDLKVFI